MGFKFSGSHDVHVEIEGDDYTIALGDSQTLDGIQKLGSELSEKRYSELDDDQMRRIEEDVDRFLKVLLGDEQYERIFSTRQPDVLDRMALLAYLYSEIEQSRVENDFSAQIAQYLPER